MKATAKITMPRTSSYSLRSPNEPPATRGSSSHANDLRTARQEQRAPSALGEALLKADAEASSDIPTDEVDRVQQVVMASLSPDGRPPRRRFGLFEWKWFIIGSLLLVSSAFAVGALSTVSWSTLAFGGIMAIVLFGMAVPTWGAGLLRRGEQRSARKAALLNHGANRVFDEALASRKAFSQ